MENKPSAEELKPQNNMKEKLAEAHSKTNYAKASLQSNEDAEYDYKPPAKG